MASAARGSVPIVGLGQATTQNHIEKHAMIGRLAFQLRRKFRHGVYTAWQRDVTRRQILNTPQISGLDDEACEIHALTCHSDWLDLMWALKSFFSVSSARFRLCIHEDGSVPAEGIDALRHHFPDARIVRRDAADELVGKRLSAFPRCAALRKTNVLSLKVFDFASFLESERLFLLDCDILFFRSPDELLKRIMNPNYRLNSVNKDWGMGYSVDPDVVKSLLPFSLETHINSGLGLMQSHSYDFELFEQWLALPGILGHPHRIEQTLVGLACSRFGHEFLPSEYDVLLKKTEPNELVKHYTGPIRHLMYKEGIGRIKPMLQQ